MRRNKKEKGKVERNKMIDALKEKERTGKESKDT